MKIVVIVFCLCLSGIAVYGIIKTIIYQVKSGLFFDAEKNRLRD